MNDAELASCVEREIALTNDTKQSGRQEAIGNGAQIANDRGRRSHLIIPPIDQPHVASQVNLPVPGKVFARLSGYSVEGYQARINRRDGR